MRPKTIGLIAHTGKEGVAELTRTLAGELERAKLIVLLETETAALAGLPGGRAVANLGREAELLVVLGGDGTILHTVGQLRENIKPVFGINIGALGFLTCANSNAYADAVKCIADGKMVFSNRTLLDVSVKIAGGESSRMVALNDVVLSRGEVSRLVRLKTSVNGETLTEFNADGLIVATPTGSTAYSFSARGPIVSPRHRCLLLTPVSPHMLFDRSLVLDAEEELLLTVTESRAVVLTLDGQELGQLDAGDSVRCTGAPKPARVVTLEPRDFHQILKAKFQLPDR